MEYSRENIGTIIRFLRTEKIGIDQSQLSKDLGVAQGTISKIENGTLEPSGSFLLSFLKKYHIPYEDFTDLLDMYIKETLRSQKKKSNLDQENLFKSLSKKIS